jgi:hypothetical protein
MPGLTLKFTWYFFEKLYVLLQLRINAHNAAVCFGRGRVCPLTLLTRGTLFGIERENISSHALSDPFRDVAAAATRSPLYCQSGF